MQIRIRYPVPKIYPILMLETTESPDLYQNDKMQINIKLRLQTFLQHRSG